MTWIVSTDIVNPAGICLEFNGEDYTPYLRQQVYDFETSFNFFAYLGNYAEEGTNEFYSHHIIISMEDLVIAYIRRVYNLPDDIRISPSVSQRAFPMPVPPNIQGSQQTFETEAEALEYVDGLGNPAALYSIPNTRSDSHILFQASWRQEIDGAFITRNIDLTYTGDPVELYTINDLVNFLASFLEITPEEIWDVFGQGLQGTPELSYDCETYLKATVVDLDGPGDTVEIDIDFTGSSIGDVTVTVVDGDPPSTSLENGDGSITISDAGNISMLNDGGTFFLNEFGNVGFYANGDASLTADNQVQLGSGGTTFNVDSNGLNMRDSTGTVSFTADELSRLKDLLN